jgi:hypothetical protein
MDTHRASFADTHAPRVAGHPHLSLCLRSWTASSFVDIHRACRHPACACGHPPRAVVAPVDTHRGSFVHSRIRVLLRQALSMVTATDGRVACLPREAKPRKRSRSSQPRHRTDRIRSRGFTRRRRRGQRTLCGRRSGTSLMTRARLPPLRVNPDRAGPAGWEFVPKEPRGRIEATRPEAGLTCVRAALGWSRAGSRRTVWREAG